MYHNPNLSSSCHLQACLSCPNAACGRYNEEHAVKHFRETKVSDQLDIVPVSWNFEKRLLGT